MEAGGELAQNLAVLVLRGQVLGGAEPEDIQRETKGRIDEARERLRGRLMSLIAWASGAGSPDREGERETG